MSLRDNRSMATSKAVALLLVAISFLLSASPVSGQIVNATLYGAVTDPTGAGVPEASITAANVSTGIATRTTSDSAGAYTLPSLPPGAYTLTVEKTGFKSTVISGITLLVNQQAQVDAQLQVGQVTTSVEVNGAGPLVSTSTASVGTVIGEREVVELPLNLRRFGSLAVLVPGTTTDNGGFASQSFGSPFSESSYAANGARSASNNTLIDGVDSRNLTFGGFAVSPPPDAVQEFKVQTNIYDAAFGKTAGSTINLLVKPGTNEIHGTVYEFLRNDKLDARNTYATSRPEYRRNQFGFSVGGPIRKNRTFFFGNFEPLRQIQGLSLQNTVPTAAMLSGDLSKQFDSEGNLVNTLTEQKANLCGTGGPANLNFDLGQLFDPATETLFNCPAGSAKAGNQILVGNPIPGNIITSVDPVAAKVLSLNAFPAPNRPGISNFVNQEPRVRNDYQFTVRLDHSISSKDQLFGHYIFGQSRIKDTTLAYTTLPGFGDTVYFRGQNVALGWTHTFGSHLLNEARVGFQRDYDIAACEQCPRPTGFMAGLGINNFQALTASDEGFPFFGFVNFAGVGDANYRPVISPDMVEKYQDNLTWTRGRHTLVVGADMQFWQVLREEAAFSPHGQIYFNGQFASLANELSTLEPSTRPNLSGISDLADFLLGYPNNAARTLRFLDTNQVGGGFWNWYAQDDIKVSPNLTVNVGLRWEYRRPAVDKRNNFATLVPLGPKFSGPGDAILVTAADNALNDSFCTDPFYSYLISASGQCLVATSAERAKLGFTGRTRRTLIFSDKKDFAPRLGITWRPSSSDKLIVHTGYGIFYDLPNFNNQHFVDNNPVFSPSQIFNTTFGAPPPANLENIFGGGAGIPPLSQQFVSLYVSPDYKAPYVQQWSFGMESQLSQNWAAEVSYIGTKSTKLGNLHLFANQPEPFGQGDIQSHRPYPDFNIMLFTTPDANANYNSLQAKVTKRFSSGFTFLTAYTFAHSIDENEGDEGFGGGVGNGNAQDDNNLGLDRGRAVNDARQRLVFSYIWELPVGKGKRYLDRGGALNQVLGGWQVSGITQFQSGFPLTVGSQDYSNTNSTNSRPDRTCSGVGKKTTSSWFDTGCFTIADLQAAHEAGTPRFGNSGRNILDGPGYNNWDFALLKHFELTERFKLEFRFELYNMWNYAQFGNPGTRVGSPSEGVITSAGQPRDIQFGLKLSF
ncbi:MAG: hypothetical protein DMG25_14215 [Acidobacteria bacterium]|nr:MAG: hypothetical protein DMG25_14215 [Acidobacteriota bacterium]